MDANNVSAVAVYGASSSAIPPEMLSVGRRLGRLLAQNGITPVCGGGRAGMMAAVIDGAIGAGGQAVGVLPEFMIQRGWNHPGLSLTIPTQSMHQRKAEMLRRADAVIALPGGIGTFEELFEAMTWRQLGLWSGRIVILDLDGYYAPLLSQLQNAVSLSFMPAQHLDLFQVADSPEMALRLIKIPDNHGPFSQKISDK